LVEKKTCWGAVVTWMEGYIISAKGELLPVCVGGCVCGGPLTDCTPHNALNSEARQCTSGK
jgi:hypothetical protein